MAAAKGVILFVSEYAGFWGGIEQYVFVTAGILRAAGWRVELLYRTVSRDSERYLTAFDHAAASEAECPARPEQVIVHRIWDDELLERLMVRYGESLALLVHDHNLYCPRHYYYTPWKRQNCSRAYAPWRCALCGLCTAPRHWPNGFSGACHELFGAFPRRFRLAHFAPHLIVLSAFMRANLVRNGFAAERIAVIPPVIQPPPDIVLPDAAHFKGALPRIGFVGQLIRGKGADLFLQALQHLSSRDWTAVIAGDGQDRPALESAIAAAHLPVELAGFVNPPWSIYAQCDIVALPFRWQEPFGLVGAEAAAAGVPVVATDLGGVRDWLKPGETGRLAPSGDMPAFARELEELLSSPAECARLGRAAHAFACDQFSAQGFLAGIQMASER